MIRLLKKLWLRFKIYKAKCARINNDEDMMFLGLPYDEWCKWDTYYYHKIYRLREQYNAI